MAPVPGSSGIGPITRAAGPGLDKLRGVDGARATLAARAGRWAALAAAVVVVIAIGLGVVGARLGPPLPAPTVAAPSVGPASTVPSPPLRRVIVDPLTHRLQVEQYLVGELPGKPFSWSDPTSTKGMFTEAVIGGVESDPGYRAGENLPPSIVVADLEPAAVIEGDLAGTARGVAAEFAQRIFRTLGDLAVSDIRSDDPTTIGDYPAQWAHANLTGTLTGGVQERIGLSVLLVTLPNGRHYAFMEVKPDRPNATPYFAAIDEAAASLRAA